MVEEKLLRWRCSFNSMSFLLLAVLLVSPGLAAERVALVIGNGEYTHVKSLKHPVGDAHEVAEVLKGLDFEVIQTNNLNHTAFKETLREFAKELNVADTAVFYFSGHGIQYKGRNYLVSADAKIESSLSLYAESVPLDEILRLMTNTTAVNIAFVDANRSNPFVAKLRNVLPTTRAVNVQRGLAQIKIEGFDTMVMLATGEGQVARDGTEIHSPFTSALLNHYRLSSVGLSICLSRY